jgi:hypothetical protein
MRPRWAVFGLLLIVWALLVGALYWLRVLNLMAVGYIGVFTFFVAVYLLDRIRSGR